MIFQNPATDRYLCHIDYELERGMLCTAFRILPRIDTSATWLCRKVLSLILCFQNPATDRYLCHATPEPPREPVAIDFQNPATDRYLCHQCFTKMASQSIRDFQNPATDRYLCHLYAAALLGVRNTHFQNPATDRYLCHASQSHKPVFYSRLSESCHGSIPLPLYPPYPPVLFLQLSESCHGSIPLPHHQTSSWYPIAQSLSESCHGSIPLPLIFVLLLRCAEFSFQNPATDRYLCHQRRCVPAACQG